jgi:excisionase family DNA binding protein
MGRPAVKPTDTAVFADFIREASVRFGVPQERMKLLMRACRDFSNDEFQVVVSLLDFAHGGTPMPKRASVSQGLVNAIRAVQDASSDPLAQVDDPMSTSEAIDALLWAEGEIQLNRQSLLEDSVSAAEAAELTGRSRQILERLRRDGRLLALRVGSQWRYPRWQFEPDAPGGVLPGLEEVMRSLHLSPAGTASWLLQPTERLGGIPPIELLRRRRPEPVIELAREQSCLP